VVLADHALITRPGAPSRRGEVGPVAAVLATHRELHTMDAPAMLDGGDVLRVGPRLFVGLSSRSDLAGAAALARVAAREQLEVHPIPVAAGLHLKSATSAPSSSTPAPSTPRRGSRSASRSSTHRSPPAATCSRSAPGCWSRPTPPRPPNCSRPAATPSPSSTCRSFTGATVP